MKRIAATALVIMATCSITTAQVYRCEQNGQTVYTDAPCLGAKKVDTTPTQGMDKWSGESRKGQDVRRAEQEQMLAEIMRPLTGKNYKEMQGRYRRYANHLTPAEHAECETLDETMEALEQKEKGAKGAQLRKIQMQLLKQRQRYRELKC